MRTGKYSDFFFFNVISENRYSISVLRFLILPSVSTLRVVDPMAQYIRNGFKEKMILGEGEKEEEEPRGAGGRERKSGIG